MPPALFLWITIATTLMGLLVHVLLSYKSGRLESWTDRATVVFS